MTEITKLTKADFNSILDNYDIGRYKHHRYIFTGGNTVHKLTTTKGDFIFKIYEQASLNFVKYQIKLMEFLNKTDVSTPKIIDTKDKKGLLIWKKKRIAIQEFVNGEKVHYAGEALARDMGEKYALLDKTLSKFKERMHGGRKEEQFRLVKWKISSLFGLDLRKESKAILKEINDLKLNKMQRGLIHGDLCEGNFLVNDNKVSAIIDWDDVHEDYIAYELAIPIAHNLVTRKVARKPLIRTFLKGYQKKIKLSDEDKKAIYIFTKHRELSAGSWSYDQIQKHPDMKDELMLWLKICLQKYKAFSKITPDEFLELAKD